MSAFAADDVQVITDKVDGVLGCCTANLYYKGKLYDTQTSCSKEVDTDTNCALAKYDLLERNPVAKLALQAQPKQEEKLTDPNN